MRDSTSKGIRNHYARLKIAGSVFFVDVESDWNIVKRNASIAISGSVALQIEYVQTK